jgi:putative transposase
MPKVAGVMHSQAWHGRRPGRTRLHLSRVGSSANGCARQGPERKDHVWAYDFVHERRVDGRRLKILTVVDDPVLLT